MARRKKTWKDFKIPDIKLKVRLKALEEAAKGKHETTQETQETSAKADDPGKKYETPQECYRRVSATWPKCEACGEPAEHRLRDNKKEPWVCMKCHVAKPMKGA